jgi:hypothetical protein
MTRAAEVSTQAVSAGFIAGGASAANAGRSHAHSVKKVVEAISISKIEVFRNIKTIAHKPFPVGLNFPDNLNGFEKAIKSKLHTGTDSKNK